MFISTPLSPAFVGCLEYHSFVFKDMQTPFSSSFLFAWTYEFNAQLCAQNWSCVFKYIQKPFSPSAFVSGAYKLPGGYRPFSRYGYPKMMITQKTARSAVMHPNNEIGTLQSVAEIGRMASDAGVLFHTDVLQDLEGLNRRLQFTSTLQVRYYSR